jgi:hypothetical protein
MIHRLLALLTILAAAGAHGAEFQLTSTRSGVRLGDRARVDFVSTHPMVVWDVYVDGEYMCQTPCASHAEPDRTFFLERRVNRRTTEWIRLRGMGPHRGNLEVQAKPGNDGKLATGIVFAALGGTGMLTGIPLTAAGCAGSSQGLCNAGLITLGAGTAVTALGTYLILTWGPKVGIRPLRHASLGVTPGGLAFQF